MAAQQSTQQQQQDTTRSSSRTFLNAVSKTIERVIPSKKPNPEANTVRKKKKQKNSKNVFVLF